MRKELGTEHLLRAAMILPNRCLKMKFGQSSKISVRRPKQEFCESAVLKIFGKRLARPAELVEG